MDENFMKKLQLLRDDCGFPFKINSGYRCKKHNDKVSKKSMGDHARGLAVDVAITDRYKREDFIGGRYKLEYFNDMAIAKTFIHIAKGRTKSGIGIY